MVAAIVGNVNFRDYINYSAIGDNVNVAWWLEGLNKQHNARIPINEATYLLVRSQVICKEIDEPRIWAGEKRKVYQLVEEQLMSSDPLQLELNFSFPQLVISPENK